MRAGLLLAGALALSGCFGDGAAVEEQMNEIQAPTAIESAMLDSAAGWNEGDMDRFLAIYSDSPETSFVGSGGLLRGVAAMEARYRDAYDWSQADPAERGVLTFETQDVRTLGPEHVLYIGRYVLTYPDDREPATGFTSLVFEDVDGEWKIVADHSS